MALVFALLLLALVPAQRPTDVVKWSAAPPASAMAAGSVAHVRITAKVQEGWKLYAIDQPKGGPVPLTIKIADGSPFSIVRKQLVSPKAKVLKEDENFAADTHYYEKEAVFTVPVSIPAAATAGPHTVPLEVTFQACGASLCLRPFTQTLGVTIPVQR